MKTVSVLIAGVGGQGLVMATKVLGNVAFREGYDVKTSDVIGLAQRGGRVWGSVRFGRDVSSPLIPEGRADYLLSLEDLEGLRWSRLLKPRSTVIMARTTVFPNRVLLEKDEYPETVDAVIREQGHEVSVVNAEDEARELGNPKLSNTLLLGYLSTYLPFSIQTWEDVIRESVPARTVELNLQAFRRGRELRITVEG
jgi:indolepyruvate ferredoxin oxidoreductase beta subunit